MSIPPEFTPVSTNTPAEYLANIVKQQAIKTVGIWGPSGSGKTTFSQELSKAIGTDKSFVWKVENYWRYTRPQMTERGLTGYHWETRDKERFLRDFTQVLEGNSIKSPVFDNIREVPTNQTITISPAEVIILEDTLDFSDIVDLGVFIYAPDTVLIERRIARDSDKTGFESVDELEIYVKTKSLPTYKSLLAPSMSHADFLLDTHQSTLYTHR